MRGNRMANLAEVLKELEQERSRLDQAILAIGSLVRKNGAGGTRQGKRAKRTLSITARRKIAAAQRARWAKWKAKKAA
jgi:hypothetical protein